MSKVNFRAQREFLDNENDHLPLGVEEETHNYHDNREPEIALRERSRQIISWPFFHSRLKYLRQARLLTLEFITSLKGIVQEAFFGCFLPIFASI